ncbi:MAG TPA: TonB-dependent receptor [Candidatus Limnocylindria bacterium]|nr:TonB-dependent receptor [Candidatus Limnocylindria bacterium]
MLSFLARRLVALVLCLATCVVITPHAVSAAGVTISGTLLDEQNHTPIASAHVVARQGTQIVATGVTNAEGQYTLTVPAAGIYVVVVTATGYASERSSDVVIPPGAAAITANLALVHGSANGTGQRQIGSVSTVDQRTALQTSVTVNRSVDPAAIESENYTRVGNALQKLPGVNLRNQNTTVSDDMYIDLRGLKPSESMALLDGHPIGPVGVLPGSSGQFNFQDSPLFALRNVQVTFGAGATGLYGTDATGGTIDLQTIDPTPQRHVDLQEGYGDDGHRITNLRATGTEGKLGYAVVYGVQGTYGGFAPQQITHNGSWGTNWTTGGNQPVQFPYTYAVSQDYLLRNDLLKLRYAFSSATNLTITGYSATSWDDKSGTDNNASPYSYQLQSAPVGNNYAKAAGCPTDVGVLTNSGIDCMTAQQWASATAGPQGGGESWQAIGNQDYHARLTTTAGNHTITVDGFADAYNLQYNRNQASAATNAAGQSYLNGSFNQNVWHSRGYLISDDFVTGQHDLGFGLYTWHEQEYGNTYNGSVLAPTIPGSIGNNNVFFRDVFTMNQKLSFFANAWFKHLSTVQRSVFDPRLSIVFRPRPADVFRLTAGRSDGEPDPSLQNQVLTAAQAINASCSSLTSGGLVNIGTIGNPNLTDESATDYEVAYGHRFGGDSMIQADYYNTHETNMLFQQSFQATPAMLAQVPPNVIAADLNYLNNNLCPQANGGINASNLAFTQATNQATGLFRGVEISGRARATRTLAFDYTYDIQQAAQYDVPNVILNSNPYIINGQQIAGIPMHTATLGADYLTRNGLHARIDGTFIGGNNGIEQPPYAWADGFVSKDVGHTTLTLGAFNLFNSHANIFSQYGTGVPYPANSYYESTHPSFQDTGFYESQKLRFLTPRAFMLTLTEHI